MPTPPEDPPAAKNQGKVHLLTFSVQEYFHVGALEGAVKPKHWSRFEPRLEKSLEEILDLLANHGARATFFVLGWVAERQPHLVRRIVASGNEVASSGYSPRGPRNMLAMEFRHDLQLARRILEDAGSGPVLGYRCPRNWFRKQDLWALDVLAGEGYLYDSSVNPVLRRFASEPRRFEVHDHGTPGGGPAIREFPISTAGYLGLRVAISGGNYIRQLPRRLLRRAVERWDRTREAPLVFYFRPWEFDADQPRLSSISLLSRIRHYRNLDRTRVVFEEYLRRFRFQAIRDHLGISPVAEDARRAEQIGVRETHGAPPSRTPSGDGVPVTLVVPLYNEEANVGYLQKTLLELRDRLYEKYDLRLCLVDDGSSDGTWAKLGDRFADLPFCTLLRHEGNRGVAAAILTGVKAACTDIVCSIDCDCSYDPVVLQEMIPLLADADLVTASPYHPEGCVFNVPRWRLFLSRTLSRLYSTLLRERFYTYTSCCRVYRKGAVEPLALRHGGFLGVAETLIRLKLAGARIVECPATLESRLFGESKMKVMRTIWSHLGLLRDLAFRRKDAFAPPAGEGVTAEETTGDGGRKSCDRK